ncbi:uncharacterized protein BJ171DRAFT_118236 [Polychytrium aggregatum]|uniref:uncharacterized protein n=1 Tax=Polychytrium aggregatum TaxID=110093 RepID=UPI0022FEFA67|nr:uncharacterized protein BJ171DRAFT_118236 [Polychytrium aggregatum]KAI9209474.1 hypothetical protein BJ171DRAFT_118236 [Polychytrium aggregatum]
MLQETEGETGRRLRDSQSRVRELEDQVRQLENSRAERQLASDEASRRLAHEASELKQTLSKLETERKQLLERTDSAEQALRVKNKMLDDQNDTIRKLKQNLDNKSREHQALLADVASREQAFTQAIEEERSVSQTLKEEFIEDLQNASIALKSERDALRKEVAEMSRRLKERNESIELIEREKVKHTFHAKQESLIVDKNEALAAKANAIAEMSQQLATQESLLASLEREKSTLMDRIARLQLDVGEQRERHEAEMAALRSEVTEQKQRMDEKLTRMKSMLASIE